MNKNDGPLILLVDDDKATVSIFEKLLYSEGYRVSKAYDGKSALKIIEEKKPKVVVLDLIMPIMDGISTMIEIKKKYPDTIVVAISGGGLNQPDGYLRGAIKLGAHAALSKPIKGNVLLDTISNLLSSNWKDL